ncbi:G-box-binding factor 1-like isoform X2 [Durio zibethinus]|uniref:G-box-binding factor 1-like isoform X2 n=1 Tax=Durio zibethinus TaxID=66656 RepID=A0A6P5Z8M5_DURZI|nr:G-box-binding factor 1-like isoform X2 [Durio zibethinus]
METEERDLIAKPKPSKQMGSSREVKSLAKSHKHKESSAAPLPQHLLNSMQIHYTQNGFSLPNSQPYCWPQVMQSNQAPQPYPGFYHKRSPHTYSILCGDSTLPIPEKGKDVPSEKSLDLMRQFKGSSGIVGHYGDRSGRIEMDGTSYRNYNHDPSRRIAAGGDEASSDESNDTNQDLSLTKKQRLNQTNADNYSMVEDSAADMLETTPNLGMIYSSAEAVSTTTKISDDSELRKQRRRQMNRESAKRSRFRKQILHCFRGQAQFMYYDTIIGFLFSSIYAFVGSLDKRISTFWIKKWAEATLEYHYIIRVDVL